MITAAQLLDTLGIVREPPPPPKRVLAGVVAEASPSDVLADADDSVDFDIEVDDVHHLSIAAVMSECRRRLAATVYTELGADATARFDRMLDAYVDKFTAPGGWAVEGDARRAARLFVDAGIASAEFMNACSENDIEAAARAAIIASYYATMIMLACPVGHSKEIPSR